MLQHCYNGTNVFTGETGVRLDYIALHKKVRVCVWLVGGSAVVIVSLGYANKTGQYIPEEKLNKESPPQKNY